MRTSTASFFLLVLTGLFCCQESSTEIEPINLELRTPDDISEQDYFLYSSILSEDMVDHLIVGQKTSTFNEPLSKFEEFFESEELNDLDRGLFQKFIETNKASIYLDDLLDVDKKDVSLFSDGAHHFFFSQNEAFRGWQLFEEQFPGSEKYFITLSRVVYSEDGNHAMLAHQDFWESKDKFGSVQQVGWIHIMKKVEGIWVMEKTGMYTL